MAIASNVPQCALADTVNQYGFTILKAPLSIQNSLCILSFVKGLTTKDITNSNRTHVMKICILNSYQNVKTIIFKFCKHERK